MTPFEKNRTKKNTGKGGHRPHRAASCRRGDAKKGPSRRTQDRLSKAGKVGGGTRRLPRATVSRTKSCESRSGVGPPRGEKKRCASVGTGSSRGESPAAKGQKKKNAAAKKWTCRRRHREGDLKGRIAVELCSTKNRSLGIMSLGSVAAATAERGKVV